MKGLTGICLVGGRRIPANNTVTQEAAQELCGCTCLEGDRNTVFKKEYGLCIADKVKFNGEGAYTMALTPNIIHFLPDICI